MRSWSRVGYGSRKSKNFFDDEPVMHCGSHVVSSKSVARKCRSPLMVSSRGSSDGWLWGKMVYFLMLAGLIIEKLCAALRGFTFQ